MHGVELETSILLNVTPELVRAGFEEDDLVASDRTHLHISDVAGYSEADLFGRPSLADAEKGRVVLDDLAARRPLR